MIVAIVVAISLLTVGCFLQDPAEDGKTGSIALVVDSGLPAKNIEPGAPPQNWECAYDELFIRIHGRLPLIKGKERI